MPGPKRDVHVHATLCLPTQVVEPKAGCCVCGSLNETGLIAFIVLLLFFWPLAWLPCVMQECHQKSQVPVYGYPPRPAA